MLKKRMCAIVCLIAIVLCGCAPGGVNWRGKVAVVGQTYLTEDAFESWYADMKQFDALMPQSLCHMLGIEGQLRDESALIAFVRYETICQTFGQASAQDAQALLEKLDIEQEDAALACARVYCTIQACMQEKTQDVQIDRQQARAWYEQQTKLQSELAKEDLFLAQENYVKGAYDVTVYVPEGLKMVMVLGITCSQRGQAQAFSLGQTAWRRLLYNDPFADIFAKYNELDAYKTADGTPKMFCIYDGWQEDEYIVRCTENLDQPGQMCGPTLCGDAYLIMRYDHAPASGVIAFELVEDQCMEAALEYHKQLAWCDVLEQMQDELQVRYAPYN